MADWRGLYNAMKTGYLGKTETIGLTLRRKVNPNWRRPRLAFRCNRKQLQARKSQERGDLVSKETVCYIVGSETLKIINHKVNKVN